VAEVTVFDMCDIAKAHELIQTGMSVGKIVVRVGNESRELPAAAEVTEGQKEKSLDDATSGEEEGVAAAPRAAGGGVNKSKKTKKKK
jgi:hypothetical protein